ncbi:protein associated with UVRAG as autophagy enhancer isoform X1 [Osmerus eperlanus]|uniref:protein associated with UVRAG as autophagy enhancer isoform X1 n=1 Tax=Osmerus eperlanus TaxID=29151 RepID=UPI002E0D1858
MSQTCPSTDAHPIRDLPSLKPSGGPQTPMLSQQPSVPSRLVHVSPCRTLPVPDSNPEPPEENIDPVRNAHSQTRPQSDTPTIRHAHSQIRSTAPHNSKDDDAGETSRDESFQGGSRHQDSSLQPPEDGQVLLPRSSPVISRSRKKSLSWHGGIEGTSLSPSPPTAAPSLGRGEALTLGPEGLFGPAEVGTAPCPRPAPEPQEQPQEQQGVSASLNRLLTSGLTLRGHLGGRGHGGEGRRLRWSSDALAKRVPNDKSKRSSDTTPCHAELYKTSCNLEQENAHFVVVDLVLEVLEAVKWTLSLSQGSAGSEHTQDRGEKTEPKPDSHQAKTLSGVSVDSGFEGGENMAVDNLDSEIELRPISRGSRFQKCFKRQRLQSPMMHCSAECLAQQLVLEFRRLWFPSQGLRRGRQSLRTSLQELPGTAPVVNDANVSLSEEIRQRTRMRGSLSWEPPRFQIIVTVLSSHRRSEVVATQHFLCAGCGTEIEPRYTKKLRYCEYLGKYFCDCCHGGAESVIPSRVLTQWDFGKYAVSDFSKQLLDSVWHQPLFDLTCVGTSLYGRVRDLDRFRELQEQLLGIKRLLKKCRLSEGVLKEFKQLPDHLTQGPHLFSMDDLVEVKRGHLLPLAKEVLRSASAHVGSCQLCLAKGFICEFCKQKDVIFPFQRGICTRCQVCKSCFHNSCFRDEECPKCLRIKLRLQRLDTKS